MRDTYYRTMNKLQEGYLYIEDEFVDSNLLPGNPIVAFINGMKDLPAIANNDDLCNYLITEMIRNFKYWETSSASTPKLRNLHWITLLLRELGAEEPVVYPSFETMESEEYLDLCVNTIKGTVAELYMIILDKVMGPVVTYISGYDYTTISDNKILGDDNTYFDIDTGKVMFIEPVEEYEEEYDEESEEKEVLREIMAISDVKSMQGKLLGKTHVHDIITLCSYLNVALKHNCNIEGIVIGDFIKLIDIGQLFTFDKNYELDVPAIEAYLERFLKSYIDFANFTKNNIYPDRELFEINCEYYTEVRKSTPDITKVNFEKGLLIERTKNLISGYVELHNGDKEEIFAIINYDKIDNDDDTLHIDVIYNLYNEMQTTMGNAIVGMLIEIGMEDLYTQLVKEK